MSEPTPSPVITAASARRSTNRPPPQWRTAQLISAAPAAGALAAGLLLLLLMLSSAAKLAPDRLAQRAKANLDRGATAEAAVDYRRLLQRFPAEPAYRDGLQSAMAAHGERSLP